MKKQVIGVPIPRLDSKPKKADEPLYESDLDKEL